MNLESIENGLSLIAIVISIAAMAVSAIMAWEIHRSQQYTAARDTCFKMLERWHSVDSRSQRMLTRETLHYLNDDFVIESSRDDVKLAIDGVCHFFRDLTILLENHLSEPQLTCRLFSDDVAYWLPLLLKVDHGDNQKWFNDGTRRAVEEFDKARTSFGLGPIKLRQPLFPAKSPRNT